MPLAGPDFPLIATRVANAVIVTGSNRVAVENIRTQAIRIFPGFNQQVKQGQKQVFDTIQTTMEMTFAQHLGNVVNFLRK